MYFALCGNHSWRFRWRLTLAAVLAAAPLAVAQQAPTLRIESGGHTSRVTQVLFTPDGQHVVSVGEDKAIRIWDVGTGLQQQVLRVPVGPKYQGRLYAAAVSPDGAALAVGGYDGIGSEREHNIRIFDLTRLDGSAGHLKMPPLHGHTNVIRGLAYSPDGSMLASCSEDGLVILWDATSGKPLKRFLHKSGVSSLAFSPDGGRLATAGGEGLMIWDVPAGKPLKLLQRNATVRFVAWSPDGKTVASARMDHKIHLWNADTGVERQPLSQNDNATCLAFSKDGALLSGSGETEAANDLNVRVWNFSAAAPIEQFTQHHATITSVAFSPDGSLAASADLSGTIYLWDPKTGQIRRQPLKGQGGAVSIVAWSGDSRRIAWGVEAPDGTPADLEYSFDLLKGTIGPPVVPKDTDWQRPGPVPDLSLERDAAGLGVAVVARGQGSGSSRLALQDPDDEIQPGCYARIPGGDVIIGSAFGLALYDPGKPKRPVREFVGHDDAIQALAVSPDGEYLASGSSDQTVRIWKLKGDEATPLLSLFRAENGQWVAWTSYGFYTGSDQGDRLLGWQVNGNPNAAPAYYDAYQYRALYYRPDVIARLVKAGTVLIARQEADAARQTGSHDVHPPAPSIDSVEAPPHIELLSPRDGDTVSQSDVKIRAAVTSSGHKIAALRLEVNGHAILSRDLQETPRVTVAGTLEELAAELEPGENELALTAVNDVGVEGTVHFRIRCQIAARAGVKPDLFVLAIGISNYLTARPLLEYAAKDAGDFAAAWKLQEGKRFARVECQVLQDQQASRSRILQAVAAFEERLQPGDWAIVYVSGHGVTSQSGYFYAGYDVDPSNIPTTGVAIQDLIGGLVRKRSITSMLVLDTCHGAAADTQPYDALLRGARSQMMTLAACQAGEKSWEDPAWGNGAFTKAVVEGLSGKADIYNEGYVTWAALDNYVDHRVRSLTGGAQHPTLVHPQTIPDGQVLALK